MKRRLAGLIVIAAVLAAALAVHAQGEGKFTRIHWDPPVTGGPVHHYTLEVVVYGASDPATMVLENIVGEHRDIHVLYGFTYKARVAGVDSLGRQGPWSLWTPLYGPQQDR